jgi:hypothetical protein
VLPIALRHLDDLRRNLDLLPTSLLQNPTAPLTHVELDLVARPAEVLRPAEHAPRHREHDRIVVERLARIAPYLGRHLAKGRLAVSVPKLV